MTEGEQEKKLCCSFVVVRPLDFRSSEPGETLRVHPFSCKCMDDTHHVSRTGRLKGLWV